MLSPTMAPELARTPIHSGLSAWLCDARRAALTSTISPGSGIPRLSVLMPKPTIRYTDIGGIACNHASTTSFPFVRSPRNACLPQGTGTPDVDVPLEGDGGGGGGLDVRVQAKVRLDEFRLHLVRGDPAVADILREVAGHPMSGADFPQRRTVGVTPGLLPPRAPRVEAAPGRRVGGRGQVTREQDLLAAVLDHRVRHGDGR